MFEVRDWVLQYTSSWTCWLGVVVVGDVFIDNPDVVAAAVAAADDGVTVADVAALADVGSVVSAAVCSTACGGRPVSGFSGHVSSGRGVTSLA